jgi:hypothetical protein
MNIRRAVISIVIFLTIGAICGVAILFIDKKPASNRSIVGYSRQYSDIGARSLCDMAPIKATSGALSWDVFATVKETQRAVSVSTVESPNDLNYKVAPVFTKEIKKYDRKSIKIRGYMFPQDVTRAGDATLIRLQTNVLMGPYPMICPSKHSHGKQAFVLPQYYHAPKNQTIDVVFDEPVTFTRKPIMVEGTLVLNNSTETSVFYRLENAKLIKNPPD